MKKRALALILAACLIFSMIPAASAEEFDASWTFDASTGTLTVSGNGYVTEPEGGYPWQVHREQITAIVFGDDVVNIGTEAFMGCTRLTSVTIPKTVSYVGDRAFADCTALVDVQYEADPDLTYTLMCQAPFQGCTALEAIQVQDGHISLRAYDGVLYSYDHWLLQYPCGRADTSYTVCDGTEMIYRNAFAGASRLEEILLPESITKIDEYAFHGVEQLKTVTFTGSAPAFDEDSFFGCTVTAVYPAGDGTWTEEVRQQYGGTVTWISSDGVMDAPQNPTSGICGENLIWSFDKATGTLTVSGEGEMYDYSTSADELPWYAHRQNITALVVEEGATSIGEFAFAYVFPVLSDVTLPSTMISIGKQAFHSCPISEIALNDGLVSLMGFSNTLLTELVIPDSVTTIGPEAFFECTRLERVVLPAGLETCGTSAFRLCSSLCQVVMPEMPNFQFFGASVFAGCALTDLSWYNQSKIAYQQFAGNGMVELEIPSCVTTIGDFAFESCKSLTSVTIPDSFESIGAAVFADCPALETITFQGDAPEIGMDAFRNTVITAFYPAGNDTWTEDIMQQYSGIVTWVPYGSTEPEPSEPEETEPTEPEPSEPEETEPTEPETSEPEEPEPTEPEPSEPEETKPTEPEETEPTEPVENPFTDVKETAYYYTPVMWALEHNITGGTSATTFSPNASCTRGQIVTFLWAANGRPEPESNSNPFKDVKKSAYYYKAVLWAVEKGITSGTSATTFSPNAPCTRAQVVTFLWAANGRPHPESAKNSFSDVKSNAYYYKSVLWAVENGITSGVGGGKFGPNMTCTRGQIVTFLYKAYQDIL